MYARLLLCTAICAAFASAGCNSRDSRTSGAEATIGSSGGALTLDSGARLEVPAGAVDVDTRFTAVSRSADRLPPAMAAAGGMVTFGPEGQLFAIPVRIEVPARTEPMVLLTRSGAGEEWTRVDGAVFDEVRQVVTADVMHFSDFVPVVPAAAPSDGGPPGTDAGTGADAGIDCSDPAHARDPACVPPTPVLPSCDAVLQDCAAGQTCIPTDQEYGYDWGDGRPARCVPAGATARDAACDSVGDCAGTLACVFPTMHDEVATWFSQEESYLPMYPSSCQRVCALADPTSCDDLGEICNPVQLWGFAGRDVNEVYGVCAPSPAPGPPR